MELVDYMVQLGGSEQPASRSLSCLLASGAAVGGGAQGELWGLWSTDQSLTSLFNWCRWCLCLQGLLMLEWIKL